MSFDLFKAICAEGVTMDDLLPSWLPSVRRARAADLVHPTQLPREQNPTQDTHSTPAAGGSPVHPVFVEKSSSQEEP